MRRATLVVGALIAVLAWTAAARASTVVYQCGAGVCAVDPASASPQPQQLNADARLAGMTRDGSTVAWVDSAGNLVKAPLAGGTPQTVYTGAVGNEPVMSPDGSQFLWWQTGPGPILGSIDVYIYRFVVGQSEPEGVSNCYQCTTTHGWLGSTAIAAFPGDSDDGDPPSEICSVMADGSNCTTRIAADARGQLAWPTGSPDGSLVAASLHRPSTGDSDFEGGLTLYSVATGGAIRDVTPGPGELEPQFSPDGTSLVFERGGQIVTRDLSSGAEKVLATGTYPFWGAAGGSTPPVTGGGGARSTTGLSVTRARLRSGRLTVAASLTPAPAGQRITVTVRAGRAHTSVRRTATRGRIAFTDRLPRSLRRARTATVTVAYGGSASQAPASASLVAARADAGLRITRLRRRGGRLELAGRISRRARGSLTLALVAGDGTAHTLHPRIRAHGSWTARVAPAGVTQLRVGYRGDRRRQLSGAQLVRRVGAG